MRQTPYPSFHSQGEQRFQTEAVWLTSSSLTFYLKTKHHPRLIGHFVHHKQNWKKDKPLGATWVRARPLTRMDSKRDPPGACPSTGETSPPQGDLETCRGIWAFTPWLGRGL